MKALVINNITTIKFITRTQCVFSRGLENTQLKQKQIIAFINRLLSATHFFTFIFLHVKHGL